MEIFATNTRKTCSKLKEKLGLEFFLVQFEIESLCRVEEEFDIRWPRNPTNLEGCFLQNREGHFSEGKMYHREQTHSKENVL